MNYLLQLKNLILLFIDHKTNMYIYYYFFQLMTIAIIVAHSNNGK